jgi:hypothetical protein
MAEHEILMSVAIDARKQQIEVTTMARGKGRHTHYPSIKQAPEAMRGEALALIRTALQHAGYSSLAELETALTSELVVPAKEHEEAPAEDATNLPAEEVKPAKKPAAAKK